MKQKNFLLISVFLVFLYTSCKKENTPSEILFSDQFECGSIGEITKTAQNTYLFRLANDNDNSDLPKTWRNWWYLSMDNTPTDTPIQITLSNRGWPYYYVPVYSYNQKDWYHFTEDEVSQNDSNELVIKKQFSEATVWLARFYPYSFNDLENYLASLHSDFLEIDTAGYSQNHHPLYILKIVDSTSSFNQKKRVLLHARTHPAEIPTSYLLEGLINFLLSGNDEAKTILSQIEFYIFPMQNVDGVIAGNYRTTPQSQNLEVMWNYDSEQPINLSANVPPEVAVIHDYALKLMTDGSPGVSIALNLHASNSEPDIRPFFYPHFGTTAQGYTSQQASLWNKQLRFINSFAYHYGSEMIEPTTEEGGSSFASKTYPESWWWVNFQDSVMAMTFEMTYGRSGYAPNWISPVEMRQMGEKLALGIAEYFNDSFIGSQQKSSQAINLKYPELYPPNAADELKE